MSRISGATAYTPTAYWCQTSAKHQLGRVALEKWSGTPITKLGEPGDAYFQTARKQCLEGLV